MLVALASAGAAAATGDEQAPADERERVRAVVDAWGKAYGEKKVDELMALYSESFSSSVLDGKRELREFYRHAIDGGMMDGFVGIQYDPAAIRIDGDRARTGQVQVVTRTSAYPLEFLLAREGESWRIVGMSDW
jgi:hypothetical protein